MHPRSPGGGKEAGMRRVLKYVCAAAATFLVVALCAGLPPYLAQKGDASFLNVIQKDERTAESYEYKVTKYQKTKVLYEAIRLNFEGNNTGIFGIAEETEEGAKDTGTQNDISVIYTEQPAADCVMTKAQAELAIVREARQLQETGAIPKFDLGEIGSYDAVESIAFLRAHDPTVSATEFYYWEGDIVNPNTEVTYRFVIDDEIGKVYFMAVEYSDDMSGTASGAFAGWESRDMQDVAAAFAQYHELTMDYEKDYAEQPPFGYGLYAMAESEFDVLAEMSYFGKFRIILKPSDIL